MSILEPTAEQESRIANLMLACGCTPGCEAGDAGRVWDLIRDMVLEEAAKACEAVRDEMTAWRRDPGSGVDRCAERIRALKGTP